MRTAKGSAQESSLFHSTGEQREDETEIKTEEISPQEEGTQTGKKALFTCTIPGCDGVFTTLANKNRHERIHSGDKPFKCEARGCGKTFARKYDMKVHQRVHTKEKPYTCDVEGCGKKFSRNSSLREHERNIHKLTPNRHKVKTVSKLLLEEIHHNETLSELAQATELTETKPAEFKQQKISQDPEEYSPQFKSEFQQFHDQFSQSLNQQEELFHQWQHTRNAVFQEEQEQARQEFLRKAEIALGNRLQQPGQGMDLWYAIVAQLGGPLPPQLSQFTTQADRNSTITRYPEMMIAPVVYQQFPSAIAPISRQLPAQHPLGPVTPPMTSIPNVSGIQHPQHPAHSPLEERTWEDEFSWEYSQNLQGNAHSQPTCGGQTSDPFPHE
jgi:hypothetical protein